jgi:hypothetical protein
MLYVRHSPLVTHNSKDDHYPSSSLTVARALARVAYPSSALLYGRVVFSVQALERGTHGRKSSDELSMCTVVGGSPTPTTSKLVSVSTRLQKVPFIHAATISRLEAVSSRHPTLHLQLCR